jgi:4-amino-4-deoxy-L-arabinose transferase-like glycosyltransferase
MRSSPTGPPSTITPMTRRELALLLPLLALFLAAWAFFPERPDDEASYVVLAERLADGFYVTGDDDALLDERPGSPDLWYGPGLPALLAPRVALDAPLSALRLTSALVLFAAVLLMYVLVRERWGPRVGLVAAYALGLYVPFLGLLSSLHSEVLAVFFMVVGMLGLARFLDRGGVQWLAVGGVGLAGLALTRVAYGWVLTLALVVLGVWWLARRSGPAGRAAAVVGLALALCVPWLTYTYAKTDRVLVWGNSGSLSLYWMTSPHEGDLGDWHQAHLVFTDPELAPHREFFEGLRGLTLAEQNAEIEREALRNIADHPLSYAENVVANVSRMLFNSPYSRTPQQTNDAFYAVSNAILLGAAVLCALVLVPRRRTLPPETGVFATLAVTAFGLHALVAAYPRMLAPIVPLLVWLTMLSLVESGLLTRAAPRGRPGPSRSS